MDLYGIFSLTGTAAMSISIAAFVAYLTQLLYKKLSGNNGTAEEESPSFASLDDRNKALEQNHHSSKLVQRLQEDQEVDDEEDEQLPVS